MVMGGDSSGLKATPSSEQVFLIYLGLRPRLFFTGGADKVGVAVSTDDGEVGVVDD